MSRLTFKSGLHKGHLEVSERAIVQHLNNLQFTMQEDPVHTYWNELGLMSNARKCYRETADPVLLIDHNMHQGTFHGYITIPQVQGTGGYPVGLVARQNVVSFYFPEVITSYVTELLICLKY